MKRVLVLIGLMIVLLGGGSVSAQTQDAEAMKRQRMEQMRQYQRDRNKKYRQFMQEMNAEYEKFIRQRWERMNGKEPVPEPKPEPEPEPVVYDDKNEQEIRNDEVLIDLEVMPKPTPKPNPVVVVEEVPVKEEKFVVIEIYGAKEKFPYNTEDNVILKGPDENGVADMWHALGDGRMNNLVKYCFDVRKERDLCDWAYYQMVVQLCETIYREHNERIVAETFILNQSGFRALMGRDDSGKLHLLMATSSSLYSYSYWEIGGVRYYALQDYGKKMESLNILQQTFPEANALRMDVTGANRFGKKMGETRHLQAEDYRGMNADVQGNEWLMKFYESYPTSFTDGNFMTRWWFYAMRPMDEDVEAMLYPTLKKSLADRTQVEKTSMLLNFVQTAFVYAYDSDVWGDDRAFFAEETLYYPYSDCEDRSILFSRLVRDLAGLDVALVYYPGHLATAVAFNEEVKGDYVMIDGRKFTVCDPTYIHAPVGLSMPSVDKSKAKAILLK